MVTVTWMAGGEVKKAQVEETPKALYALMLREQTNYVANIFSVSLKSGMTFTMWKADHYVREAREAWVNHPSWWAELCGRLLAEKREALQTMGDWKIARRAQAQDDAVAEAIADKIDEAEVAP